MALPTIVVRIAFATAPMADTPTWTDVSADVMSFSTRRGKNHELNREEAGTATVVLLNTSGDYWPDNAGGSYYGNVKPKKKINIRVTWDAVTYDLFTGFIESWRPSFLGPPDKGPIMTLQCSDGLKYLAGFELNDAVGYSEEASGTRIGNVLDDLDWPAADRDLDAGQSDVIATGALANESAISHLQAVQDAELGILYVSGDGKMVFKDRHARLTDVVSTTPQATFSIDDDDQQLTVGSDLALEDTYIKNEIRLTREGGTEQVESDATSITTYGQVTLSKTGLLLTSDTETANQASYILYRYKDPAMRIKSLIIKSGIDEVDLYPKALGYDIGYRITVQLDQASIDTDYFIERIEHNWSAREPQALTTRWMLTYANADSMWILGDAAMGILGSTTRVAY